MSSALAQTSVNMEVTESSEASSSISDAYMRRGRLTSGHYLSQSTDQVDSHDSASNALEFGTSVNMIASSTSPGSFRGERDMMDTSRDELLFTPVKRIKGNERYRNADQEWHVQVH